MNREKFRLLLLEPELILFLKHPARRDESSKISTITSGTRVNTFSEDSARVREDES
ncbi:MAG: hypothetical protein F6K40_36050 [Okeania sp. SIO3I5]|uniref:hypothetical protein n=1 Tax=Okeania sp. SIO3I5 TaxID=2607805 RepID=UPI0013B5B48A|nr:hypothetical protein [Okeania sp. SIO3I5]NEQ41321.1 hypothetical protein [Okeania sp. SIO3I5]